MSKILFFDFFVVICNEVTPLWLKLNGLEHCLKTIRETVLTTLDLGEISEADLYEIISDITGVESKKINSISKFRHI